MSNNQLLMICWTFFFKRKMVCRVHELLWQNWADDYLENSFLKVFFDKFYLKIVFINHIDEGFGYMLKMLKWHCAQDVAKLKAFLLENKLFIGSTDTVLGIMCKVDKSLKGAIDNVKIRSGKSYVVLVDSIEKVSKLCVVDPTLISFLKSCWPGPVTVVLPVGQDAPEWMKEQGTLAVRIPDHKGLQTILADLPFGLYSTSANISGESVPRSFSEIAPQIKEACACYIDDQEGCKDLPSTIIDCTQGVLRVIRSGAYPIDRLQELYNRASD